MKKRSLQGILVGLVFLLGTLNPLYAHKEGQDLIDSLIIRLKQHYNEDTARVNLLNEIGWEMQSTDPLKGIDFATQGLKLAEKLGYKQGIGKSLLSMGVCYYTKSDNDKALELYKRSLKILEEVDDKSAVATVLLNIGNIYFNRSDFTGTLENYNKALKVLQDLGDEKRCASVYGNIGNVYYVQSNYPKSLEYQFKSCQLAEKTGNLKVQGNALVGIGNIYTRLPDYPKALENFFKSLKLFEVTGNKKGKASSLGNIGIVYYRQSEYSKALEYFYKALAISEELGDRRGCAITYTNIGNVYSNQKDNNKALESHLKAYTLFKETGSKGGMASTLGNIGLVNTEMHNYAEALSYYRQAYELNSSLGNKSGTLYNLKGMGSLYLKMVTDSLNPSTLEKKSRAVVNRTQALHQAISNSLEAIRIGKELNELDPMIEAYDVISRSYQLLNDWKKAFQYSDSADVLQDSVFNIENQRKISEIEAKRASELKEKEIQIIALSIKHQRIAITAISVVLLLMIVIALLIYRSLRIKRRTNKWLEEQVNKRTQELRIANEDLEKAHRELLELEESKAEFLKLISHEIRTPLNGIIGFTSLLKEELQFSEVSGIIDYLDTSVKRLERFSVAALLITELRNKSLSLNYASHSFETLIREAVNRNEKNIQKMETRIIYEGDQDKIFINGDSELLGICLETMVDNAVKYSDQGGEVIIRCQEKENEVICEVIDHGRGFTEEALEHAFQLFAIGERHIDNNTGLSLAMVKLIMEAHQSKVEVGNNAGSGAFVRLIFTA
ncbi:MAG: tetratricopeptide repeat-containing sensor histidine kinase [Bacteroidetes bacterium]|nr:tetratricopeptide repeat-containing sensor histidine kinase [Bacteroidota bacterium]